MCVYIHIYTYIYIYIYTYLYIYIYIYIYTYTYVHTYKCINVYIYIYIHTYTYTYCINIYLFNTQAHAQTHREPAQPACHAALSHPRLQVKLGAGCNQLFCYIHVAVFARLHQRRPTLQAAASLNRIRSYCASGSSSSVELVLALSRLSTHTCASTMRVEVCV